ncbi:MULTISPECIES: DUF6456 domain-containing protein [Sphingobium]|uniref:DUF6456 domain-containing protein n=1 Tax=Sphingobium TaxID=165695 RepID=UPI0015EB2CA1|nr:MULTISPECIES: DUF6456 domain-containing protein [Sphingobium]MCW2361410.1 hypothetical protein [Sphingobium sp. B10D3B]MCW2387663.1 hypothetical protein [Sphingobium sp. B11D3B]MCW2394195.1 hypothetical protein [Sphingobium sp. B8D3B]MCW2401911.1 hypothetical protein [Sphingobium sp. B10D7B]MCW2408890.1 hypothetical protein [Sphingobium xanthum]
MAERRGKTVERVIEGPDGRRERVMVNMAESPTSWLHARGMLSQRQFDAAEALRRDWEQAGMGARVTMNWDLAAVPVRAGRGGAPGQAPTLAGMSARDRLNGALAAAGPGLVDILWRVVCACESLVAAERALGWPARAGKLVLGFALDRVGDFYRIR